MSAGNLGGQGRALDLLGLELQEVVSHPMLLAEFKTSGRAVRTNSYPLSLLSSPKAECFQ